MHHHACLLCPNASLKPPRPASAIQFPCPTEASAMSSAGGSFRQTDILTVFFLSARLFFFPSPFSPYSQFLFIRGNPFHREKSPSFQLLLFRINTLAHTLNFTMNMQQSPSRHLLPLVVTHANRPPAMSADWTQKASTKIAPSPNPAASMLSIKTIIRTFAYT